MSAGKCSNEWNRFANADYDTLVPWPCPQPRPRSLRACRPDRAVHCRAGVGSQFGLDMRRRPSIQRFEDRSHMLREAIEREIKRRERQQRDR